MALIVNGGLLSEMVFNAKTPGLVQDWGFVSSQSAIILFRTRCYFPAKNSSN